MRRPADGSRAVRCAANTAGIGRLAGIVAGALLLAYAVAFPAPAQAQSTDPVWSTTMTVGNPTGDGRGYNTDGDGHGSLGSLGDNEFTLPGDSTAYVVNKLTVDTNFQVGAIFSLNGLSEDGSHGQAPNLQY